MGNMLNVGNMVTIYVYGVKYERQEMEHTLWKIILTYNSMLESFLNLHVYIFNFWCSLVQEYNIPSGHSDVFKCRLEFLFISVTLITAEKNGLL